MKKLNEEEIRKYSLEVLCQIKKICDEHGIKYSLTGGTLLGAIRHNGFIPWDDDIDIMLPREDYNHFLDIVSNGEFGFNLFAEEICGINYNYPFAKACHKKTLLIEKGVKNLGINLGVYVDVFPIDGAGNCYLFSKLYGSIFQVLHGLKLMATWEKYKKSKLRKWYYEPIRMICYGLSKCIGLKTINSIIKWYLNLYSYKDSKYVGRLVGDYGRKEVMPRRIFDTCEDVLFENELFKAICEYDYFLSVLYGDYMTLPPVEKRVSHHEFNAYRVEENEGFNY